MRASPTEEMLRFDVKKILRNRQMSRIVDPIELICYELIGKVSKETSKELVSVSIDEVTQEYKTNCTINRIVRQNIIPLSITELVKQSAHECIVETMFDDIIERLAFELIEPLSVVCMQEEKEKADKENLMRQEKLNKKRALNDVLRTDIGTKLRTVE